MTTDLTIPKPQTPATIGHTAEATRAETETQSALAIAARFRRDPTQAAEEITTACQRPRVAQTAAYAYSRGGTAITGPSIRLLELVAAAWGNLTYGWREIETTRDASTIECYAWDLQTNVKRAVTVTVPHQRAAQGSTIRLTDPRDIYEHVANHAARRVRACLEAIIPTDILEDALETAAETLRTHDPVTEDSLRKLLDAFAAHHVTRDQIEARLQRRLETITPGQLHGLRQIYRSLADGMSTPASWFKPAPAPPTELETALKTPAKPKQPAKKPTKKPTTEHLTDEELYARAQAEAFEAEEPAP